MAAPVFSVVVMRPCPSRARFTGDRRPVAVVTRVPVAGSSITDSSLIGEWCAEVFLDDEDAPIARRRFDLLEP